MYVCSKRLRCLLLQQHKERRETECSHTHHCLTVHTEIASEVFLLISWSTSSLATRVDTIRLDGRRLHIFRIRIRSCFRNDVFWFQMRNVRQHLGIVCHYPSPGCHFTFFTPFFLLLRCWSCYHDLCTCSSFPFRCRILLAARYLFCSLQITWR